MNPTHDLYERMAARLAQNAFTADSDDLLPPEDEPTEAVAFVLSDLPLPSGRPDPFDKPLSLDTEENQRRSAFNVRIPTAPRVPRLLTPEGARIRSERALRRTASVRIGDPPSNQLHPDATWAESSPPTTRSTVLPPRWTGPSPSFPLTVQPIESPDDSKAESSTGQRGRRPLRCAGAPRPRAAGAAMRPRRPAPPPGQGPVMRTSARGERRTPRKRVARSHPRLGPAMRGYNPRTSAR